LFTCSNLQPQLQPHLTQGIAPLSCVLRPMTIRCYSLKWVPGLRGTKGIAAWSFEPIRFKHPEDPRLLVVLITLGNALRKSTPAEAESCYREAADWHVAKG
jgi:hypothetical protein